MFVCCTFQAASKKAPKAPARKRQATVVKTASSKPRTAADAIKAKKEASAAAAAAKGKKGKTPAAKAKKVRSRQLISWGAMLYLTSKLRGGVKKTFNFAKKKHVDFAEIMYSMYSN